MELSEKKLWISIIILYVVTISIMTMLDYYKGIIPMWKLITKPLIMMSWAIYVLGIRVLIEKIIIFFLKIVKMDNNNDVKK